MDQPIASSEKPFKRYEVVTNIFKLIDSLSDSKRIEVFKKIASNNLTKILRELVVDLPQLKLEELHEELERTHQGRRAHPRKNCVLTADYHYENRAYCDFVKDISEGGVFVYSQVDFENEDEIEVSFNFPNIEHPIEFSGEIVRSDESGIGIRFLKMNNYKKDVLHSHLNDLKCL